MCSAGSGPGITKGKFAKGVVTQGSGGTAGGIDVERAMGAGFGPKRKAARLPMMPLLGLTSPEGII